MFEWLRKYFSSREINEWTPLIGDTAPSDFFPWGWEKEVAYYRNCDGIGRKNNSSPECQFDSECMLRHGESW
jgi:hypothetical protein